MFEAKRIEGIVFRIKTTTGGHLVEVPSGGDTEGELARYCARLAVDGHIISSVTRVKEIGTDTPRVSVLTTKAFKAEAERLRKERAE